MWFARFFVPWLRLSTFRSTMKRKHFSLHCAHLLVPWQQEKRKRMIVCIAEIACRDIALPMGVDDDAILAILKTTTQNGVLQGRPHLSKGQAYDSPLARAPRGVYIHLSYLELLNNIIQKKTNYLFCVSLSFSYLCKQKHAKLCVTTKKK